MAKSPHHLELGRWGNRLSASIEDLENKIAKLHATENSGHSVKSTIRGRYQKVRNRDNANQ